VTLFQLIYLMICAACSVIGGMLAVAILRRPTLERLSKLRLEEGDVVILSCDRSISASGRLLLSQRWKDSGVLPGVRLLILDEGIKITVAGRPIAVSTSK
jgi:hypothetical protein